MEPNLALLTHTALFATLITEEITHALGCLGAYRRRYQARQFIVHAQDPLSDIGLVLEGTIQIITEDTLGNRSITATFGTGELFGETLASAQTHISHVSVVADTDCHILYMKLHKITTPCAKACQFHARIIENLVGILGQRNLMMNRKLSILSQRSTRDKLLAYLAWQNQDHGTHAFDIPYNRDELADYLCVNRSALSREISHMVSEGLIANERNHFTLLEPVFL